jgi:hypothetical protein
MMQPRAILRVMEPKTEYLDAWQQLHKEHEHGKRLPLQIVVSQFETVGYCSACSK